MPEVLKIETDVWDLSVWTKDIKKPCILLAKTMRSRGKQLPCSAVYFCPPLKIKDIAPGPIVAIPEPATGFTIPAPVFFENRLYEFDFRIKGDVAALAPKVEHWRNDVQDVFHLAGQSLRGSINFGNDIGWFRLGISFNNGTTRIKQNMSFEVLPTKMDMAGDFDQINRDIDSAYPLWRFSFAGKTEQEQGASRKAFEHFPLLWLALFRSLRTELEDAVKLICRSPHARLLPQERYLRPDCLKGRLTPRLEERVREQCRNGDQNIRHKVESRRLSVDTPENRFVKMVLTRCTRNLSNFVNRARQHDRAPEQSRLSQTFYDELDSWQKPLEQRLSEPLFHELGSFEGMAQESLVLHQRTGYARVYTIWQQLKLYLELFGRHSSVSMKSLADLYEVWCLLEIRKMLIGIKDQAGKVIYPGLGFEEKEIRKASLKMKGLEKDLIDGMGTAFRFERRDGLRIRLAHEPPFRVSDNFDVRGIFSWTTPQKPDILMEATFRGGERIRWIFDAKYRISAEENGDDQIPDDAINQMHRYRDALINLEKADDGINEKSRPIVGAFVLYPGFFNSEEGHNPYQKGIETVGIGGFPLLPGRENRWLKVFLKNKFGDLSDEKSTDRALEPDEHLLHDSVRIPPSGLSLSRYEDLTLVASLGNVAKRDKQYIDRYLSGNAGWYHVPVSTADKRISRTVMRELRYCAIAVHHHGETERKIEYLYDVISVHLLPRCKLSVEQAGSVKPDNKSDYWLLKLGAARNLQTPVKTGGIRSFRIRLTLAEDLFAAKKWEDISEHYQHIISEKQY
ncbi:MAG: hypothetical protein CVU71_07250 [Deltaproteobacteria bacterium HGW-Deltaproteobacteria-6]|nr:MAG: hypothetical protein CVU71_07250 [Deltaproteobacteria bacterium HGW-Deltaproteobacteria-6]